MRLLEWERAPAGYRVAFSTRLGGVSEGPYASLNLGILTEDDPASVSENRSRLCEAVGADAETATMAWQVHGSDVTEAQPRGILERTLFERCDGLWTDRPGQAMGLLTADCFPLALAKTNGAPRLCVLHVGWRGLLGGILDSGLAAMADGPLAGAIGPGIGRCCYEVGEEVAVPFRARFGDGIVTEGRLDLGGAIAQSLSEAGVADVERSPHCTACEPELFFSHRRDHGLTGRQGVIAYIR
jgi:polyphenol oxidase